MTLGPDQLRRYARHLSLPEIGPSGQMKFSSARVLCIGAGGLGSPILMYLAAAGIGRLGIVDFDTVEESNLQRQIIHSTNTVGQPKTESAQQTIHRLNPLVDVTLHPIRLSSDNALGIIAQYDLVVDGTDNFPTRYLTNDACVFLKKPNIYGAVLRFEGQASVFAPHLGAPCYRCLFPTPPAPGTIPNCAEGGILGVMPGLIGLIQATEILKLVSGAGQPLLNRLLVVNALEMKFRELKLRRDPNCPVCGNSPTITKLENYGPTCGLSPNPMSTSPTPDEVTVQDLKKALDNPSLHIKAIDVREPDEFLIAHIPGVIQLPLSQLPTRFTELDPKQSYYLHCKGGVRSLKAVHFLKEKGFASVKSVQGGILAWSTAIDPSVPKY